MSFPSYGTCQPWVLFQPCLWPWSTPCLPLSLHPGSPARTNRLSPVDCQLRVVSTSNRKTPNIFRRAEMFKSASKPASSQHISTLKQLQAIVVLLTTIGHDYICQLSQKTTVQGCQTETRTPQAACPQGDISLLQQTHFQLGARPRAVSPSPRQRKCAVSLVVWSFTSVLRRAL